MTKTNAKTFRQTCEKPPAEERAQVGKELKARKATATVHEHHIAKLLGGRTTPASGALGMPGDVVAEPFAVSCKQTGLRIYSLELAEVEKIVGEAVELQLTALMALRLDSIVAGVPRDWMLVPASVFAALAARARTEKATTGS